jgi:anti-anti-sigma factor
MFPVNDPSIGTDQFNLKRESEPATSPPLMRDVAILYVDHPLSWGVTDELRHQVHSILRRGAKTIVLDLSGVSRIDAAGVGQLVRAYNVAVAAECALRLVHAPARVREILQRVGLFSLFSGGVESDYHQ